MLRKLSYKYLGYAFLLVVTVYLVQYIFTPAYEGNVGIEYDSAFAPKRDENIDFHIWYPANSGGRSVTVGGNGVFFGTKAGKGAIHRKGKFPAILISHGAGGNAGQFGWIASKLAEAGFVVLLPNHPGSTSGNASAKEAVKLWERPPDLSAVIDKIEKDEKYAFIDKTKIAVLGFSAGGYTAMAISGAIVDPQKLENFCDGQKTGMSDCEFLKKGGVDLHKLDLSPAQQSHLDSRIKTAVIIDPGTVQTLTTESLKAIKIPMLIINLGSGNKIPPAVLAKDAANQIPKASYVTISDAIHFSFLAECKEKGRQILIDEEEVDPLCDDAGGRTRNKIHEELSAHIIEYLQENLK